VPLQPYPYDPVLRHGGLICACVCVGPARAQIRSLLPEKRLFLEDQVLPYDAALSVLDPFWSWSGLCMYGHGCFVKPWRLLGRREDEQPSSGEAGTSGEGEEEDEDEDEGPSVVDVFRSAVRLGRWAGAWCWVG
jgi:hypothetical protein